MAPITPTLSPYHLTDLILQKYLGTKTGITNWQDFNGVANLAPPDDDSVAYAACIWPIQIKSSNQALRRTWNPEILWGVRFVIANTDAGLVSRYSLWWADKLDQLLESAATPPADLSGTFELQPTNVVVPANFYLAVSRQPWTIVVDENESGGAVGVVSTKFMVKG